MPWMPDLLSVVTGTEGQLISQVTVKTTSLRAILEQLDMPVIRLRRPESPMMYDVLLVNTAEGSWMQKKMQHSFKYICLTLGIEC